MIQNIYTEQDEIVSHGLMIVCEVCGKAISRLDYDRHMKTHKEKRVEVCNICFKAFTNLSNYKYHLAHHSNERPWLCNECPKNYKTKIDLLQHQRVHDKARDPFHCETCGQYFRTRSNFNTHLRTHSVRGPQKCTICDKTFVNLRSHIQMVHQKIRQHICSICSKAFGKKSGLDRHIITVHEKMKCWACDLCEKSFGEKAQLLRHRKIHFKPSCQEPDPTQVTEDREIFFKDKTRMQCGFCKKIVNSRSALKRHKMLVHEKKKNLLCDFCPKLFGEKSNLMRHIMKSHRKESEFDNYSDEFFCVKEEIKGERIEEFSCSTCSHVYSTKWKLEAHESQCLILQEEKLNDVEDASEMHDFDTEQVFLMADEENEAVEVKSEPNFVDENYENVTTHIVVHAETFEQEPLDMKIKEEMIVDEDEIIEEYLDPYEIQPEAENGKDDEIEIFNEYISEDNEENFIHQNAVDDGISEPEVTFLKRYKCKLCPSTFKEKRYFQSHFETVHGKKRNLKCGIDGCNEMFIYRAQRLRHHRLKHPEIYEESDNDESFQCQICDLLFEDSKDLNDHLKKDHELNDDDENSRTCDICVPIKSFNNGEDLINHVHSFHSDKRTYNCEQISESFPLERHINDVHNNLCEFSDNDGTINHDEKNKKSNKSERTCKVCMKVFKKVKYLELHFSSVHTSEPQYSCPICNRSFSFRRSMQRHIQAIHEDRRDFKCTSDGCQKAFRCRYDLNEHFNNIHAEVKKKQPVESVTCDVCDKICSSRKVLYSHKKMVHEAKHWGQVHRFGEIKTRTCHLCGADFQLFNDFKLHIESHVGYFICITCGLCFPDESSLFIHIESHRKIEEELRLFVCDVCSYRISTKAQLLIHMRKHFSCDHYMCDICGKFYKFITPFLHHKKCHDNRFDFPCRYCEKKFRVSRDRMLHERTHTGERPYKCEQCFKSFSANYFNHLKTHESKAFICKTCGLQVTSETKLRQHIDNEHPEERPFRCCHCRKSFKASHTLETHRQKCEVSLGVHDNKRFLIPKF
ncbi:CLUMA_CG013090, isoform A [Clunio marinus]|uniref:CLUMA_CG013090, isoform A n=1 Tax=Clunio marinus TaxID=568069 RepID=A0A1J1IL24_9DIPT|nr:CLUMA_CG013090, isoform A [Clunio marinus]